MGGPSSAMEHCTRNKLRLISLMCILCFALSGVVYLGYFCPDKVCALTNRNPTSYPVTRLKMQSLPQPQSQTITNDRTSAEDFDVVQEFGGDSGGGLARIISYSDIDNKKVKFDIHGNDVMVFLHIQKTGGTTFGRHLVEDLDLEYPCQCKESRKRCLCHRSESDRTPWLFSRYSTGWACGLHADWTEMSNCVDGAMNEIEETQATRRYFFVTLLRDPVQRFLSEFLHVRRGATWKQAKHWCGGRLATPEELPKCFSSETWEGVTLRAFMACRHNLAINRQARMLADLALVNCYNHSGMSAEDRDRLILDSAKRNLEGMAFYGLCEHQQATQAIFEQTFDIRFLSKLVRYNDTHVADVIEGVDEDDLQQIRRLNSLDVQLYEFARELLLRRFKSQQDGSRSVGSSDIRRKKPGGATVWEDESYDSM